MIGLFSCVYSQVAFQCLQMAETSATDLAWIWLLSGMNQNVSPKVSDLCKKGYVILSNLFFYISTIDCNSKHSPAQI